MYQYINKYWRWHGKDDHVLSEYVQLLTWEYKVFRRSDVFESIHLVRLRIENWPLWRSENTPQVSIWLWPSWDRPSLMGIWCPRVINVDRTISAVSTYLWRSPVSGNTSLEVQPINENDTRDVLSQKSQRMYPFRKKNECRQHFFSIFFFF